MLNTNSLKNTLLFYLTVCLTACNSSPENTSALTEAGKIHNEAVASHDSLTKMVTAEFPGLRQKLAARKQTIPADSVLFQQYSEAITSLDETATELEEWEENIVEVPGNEHVHKAGEKHEHKPAPDVTPEQMLAIQKEMRVNLRTISDNLRQVKLQAEEMLK
jgi:hypothetical protein